MQLKKKKKRGVSAWCVSEKVQHVRLGVRQGANHMRHHLLVPATGLLERWRDGIFSIVVVNSSMEADATPATTTAASAASPGQADKQTATEK